MWGNGLSYPNSPDSSKWKVKSNSTRRGGTVWNFKIISDMPAVKRIVRLHLINTTYMHINYITVGTFVDPMYQLLSAAKRQQLTSAYKKMMFHKAISFTLEWIDKRRSLIEKLESGWVHPLADKYPGYTSEYLIDKSRRAIAACEECLANADMLWEVQSSNGDCFFPELMNLMRKHCA